MVQAERQFHRTGRQFEQITGHESLKGRLRIFGITRLGTEKKILHCRRNVPVQECRIEPGNVLARDAANRSDRADTRAGYQIIAVNRVLEDDIGRIGAVRFAVLVVEVEAPVVRDIATYANQVSRIINLDESAEMVGNRGRAENVEASPTNRRWLRPPANATRVIIVDKSPELPQPVARGLATIE